MDTPPLEQPVSQHGREAWMNFNNLSFPIGKGHFADQDFDSLGGLFLLLTGAVLFYTLASWRFRGLQVDGEIIGVRRRGSYVHGVYRYVLPSGEYCEATCVQGRNSSRGLLTGRRVPIQVMTDKLDEAREQHAPMLWALAIGLLLSGIWFIHVAATVSKHSPPWIPIVLAVAFEAHWLWRRMQALIAKRRSDRVSQPWSTLPIKPAEFQGSPPARARECQSRARKLSDAAKAGL
jgi:hypothetical protein